MGAQASPADHVATGRKHDGSRRNDDMDILTRIGCWLQGPRTPPSAGRGRCAPRAEGVDGELPCTLDVPCGCGWFDSSLDLKQGLAVIEHEGIDLGLAVEALLSSGGLRLQ
jgi:hypothetical protein